MTRSFNTDSDKSWSGNRRHRISGDAPSIDTITGELLKRISLDIQPLGLWWELRAAFQRAVPGCRVELYLNYFKGRRLRRLSLGETGYLLSYSLPRAAAELATDAAHEGVCLEGCSGDGLTELAIPVYSQPRPDSGSRPVAIVSVVVEDSRVAVGVARQQLVALARALWPIAAFANNQQRQIVFAREISGLATTSVDYVLSVILETVTLGLGFEFGWVSVVDNDAGELRTVRGSRVPGADGDVTADGDSSPLDSARIHAEVARTGELVIVSGWDDRLDRARYEELSNEDLVRIFVPLGKIGVIEAGYRDQSRSNIDQFLVTILQHYSREVSVWVQNAILGEAYETERRFSAALARLHRVTSELQAGTRAWDELEQLQGIVDAALKVLEADVVTLHPVNLRTGALDQIPIVAGELKGVTPLRPPGVGDNVVTRVARTRRPHYQAHADLESPASDGAGQPGGHSPRNLIERQRIRSFVGLPLLTGNGLVGVLCVNYRTRRRFRSRDRQIVELFAAQAEAVIGAGNLIRERERERSERDRDRRRLARDLHDSVKSSVRGLGLLQRSASDAIDAHDVQKARNDLQIAQRVTRDMLADMTLILGSLTAEQDDSRTLQSVIEESLLRFSGDQRHLIDLWVSESLSGLSFSMSRTVVHVVGEAVVNALQHSAATAISIEVRDADVGVHVRVVDNGRGFETAVVGNSTNHGLSFMRERVEDLGGELQVVSAPGAGTIVSAVIPYRLHADVD